MSQILPLAIQPLLPYTPQTYGIDVNNGLANTLEAGDWAYSDVRVRAEGAGGTWPWPDYPTRLITLLVTDANSVIGNVDIYDHSVFIPSGGKTNGPVRIWPTPFGLANAGLLAFRLEAASTATVKRPDGTTFNVTPGGSTVELNNENFDAQYGQRYEVSGTRFLGQPIDMTFIVMPPKEADRSDRFWRVTFDDV